MSVATLLQGPRRGGTPCAILVTVKFEHFNFEGDLATARTSTSRCFRGRSHSTSCAASLNLCLRRSFATSTLGGGDHHLPERDCGKKDKIVKNTYIYMAKECKLCRLGDGVCIQGFRKQHERSDPNWRLHGVAGRANGPRQLSEGTSCAEPSQLEGSTTTPRPLTEMTQFLTRRGSLMLFKPQPTDAWIGAEVLEDQQAGGYREVATGKLLSQRRTAAYKAFRKRHAQRCRMGDAVDTYFKLVDKYQPKVFAEARIYIARFPQQVGELLKQIKKVRKKVRKMRKIRQASRQAPNKTGEAVALAMEPDAPHDEGTSRDGDQQAEQAPAVGGEHVKKGDEDTVREKKENVREETPPDWGDSSDDSAPAHEWPWGKTGRPSDRGDSPSHLALRPNEPSAGGPLRLVPNEHWRGVQLIQDHMANARRRIARRPEDTP